MKLRQQLKKLKQKTHKEKEQKSLMLLNEALKKLIEYQIAVVDENKIRYSSAFEKTVQDIISSPPGRIQQIRLGNEAGRKLIPQILASAISHPSRRDIENMLTAYVCLKTHINQNNLQIDKKLLPDLAYAVWYLNDNNPTMEEIEKWT